MNSCLILNGTLVTAETSRMEDLVIADGKIFSTGKVDPTEFHDFPVIDAAGKFVIPGGFDPHVHFALPTPAGKSCDDFRSGSLAALEGGTTFFMDFVTPHRGQSLIEALHLRREEATESMTPYDLHMGISEWNPKVAWELEKCIEREGVKSFKAYLAYRDSIGISSNELEELMKIVGPSGGVVMVHCEDGLMIGELQRKLILEGKTRACYHASSRPPEAEIRAVGKVIESAARTNCAVYIVHTSTAAGAGMILDAKKSGIRIYAETCPHYLLLDDSVYNHGIPDLKVMPYIMSPPLRSRADQQRLWEGLSDGTFDVVATDHCPFNLYGQKDQGLNDFTRIQNGVGSIRHRLSLLYTFGVLSQKITMNQFVNLVSTRPAEIFGFGNRKGKLLPGYDADIVIWDPEFKDVITVNQPHQTCDSDIYAGFQTTGNAAIVMSQGVVVDFNL